MLLSWEVISVCTLPPKSSRRFTDGPGFDVSRLGAGGHTMVLTMRWFSGVTKSASVSSIGELTGELTGTGVDIAGGIMKSPPRSQILASRAGVDCTVGRPSIRKKTVKKVVETLSRFHGTDDNFFG